MALFNSAISGNLTRVRLLVGQLGMDPETSNAMGWTPLNLAALSGHLDIVAYLVESGANIETRQRWGQSPLGSAAINGHVNVVRFLMDHSPPANTSSRDSDGALPIHYASQFGFVDCLKVMLEHGADVNAVATINGWTPLHTAAAAGQAEAVELLLEWGADAGARDRGGRRAVDLVGMTVAVTRRQYREIGCLLERRRCPGASPAPEEASDGRHDNMMVSG
ncbi:unnamed protein product [Ostreobium quekettii]|uniref:Uncharacterized protein n=1 Tax=Ostreobium quekettii TaxID=121088 RepID=A0A8S1JCL0_9CHLO|nr:unnamed protein product [Ostreobium quekettii]|eukprot:evm.model.scf_1214EXC.5 EVM.evm.TU.scf_1214EXC.5   scf_1214EXC:44846-46721(-)